MNNRLRSVVRIVMALSWVSGLGGLVVQSVTPVQSWCRQVQGWGQGVSAQALPTNLNQFLEIPKTYRMAIWSLLSPQAKSTVMRETFQAAMDTGTLTAEQVEFLKAEIARVTPEFYAESARLTKEARAKADAKGERDAVRDDALFKEDEARMVIRGRLFTRQQLDELLSPFRLPQRMPKQVSLVLPTFWHSCRACAAH